jgi:hypothetical protein
MKIIIETIHVAGRKYGKSSIRDVVCDYLVTRSINVSNATLYLTNNSL